jgi:hypothetical protein
MPILALLPSLFGLMTTVVGPIVEEHKTSIISQIVNGAFDGSSSSLMNIIEGAIGKIADQKKIELQAQIQTLLAQADITKTDAQSESWVKYGWRLAIAWGLGLNLVIHYTLVNAIDIINSLVGTNISQIPPMDHMALLIITGLLGLYMGARTYEKTQN